MRLEADGVRKSYGDVTALDGLSLTIPSGSTFGLLGTNGAGKTTLFRLLVGHEAPDEGTVSVGGLDVATAGERIRERVGYLPEKVGFPPRLTGREVLAFHARMRDLPADRRGDRIDEVLDTVGLADAADRRVDGYSNGMGQRLGLASVLLSRPDVLILDEPTAGLDPRGVAAFHRIVRRVGAETGATVVFSSHVLPEVERLCDRVAVLHGGTVHREGPVDAVRADAGDGVTVSIRPGTDADRAGLVDDAAAVGAVTVEHPRVLVDCDRSDALDLLADVREDYDIERFEVREGGLEAAFRDALPDDEASAPGDEAPPDGGAAADGEVIAR